MTNRFVAELRRVYCSYMTSPEIYIDDLNFADGYA